MSSDYNIGFKKPPKQSQFQPGSSGNPKGRPKGSKNLKTDLIEELAEKIGIKENGNAKTVSKQRAMLKSLMLKAVQGDTKASMVILNMILKILVDEQAQAEPVELTPTDQKILEQYKTEILATAKRKKVRKIGK